MKQIEALLSFRRRAFCEQPLTREVSLPQLHVLMRLVEIGPTTVSDLAHSLTISSPSASAILDRMEEHGLIERVRDAADRRVVRVAASARGRVIVQEFGGPKQAQLQSLLGTMTDEELSDVVRAAEALRRALGRMGQPGTVEAAS
jgi:DNA-binding MarR family transcriptional regulator